MSVSLKDVAEHAGVSVKTVSNVVNKYPHVAPAMREKVQRAIDELGYRPNLSARHLRKGRTGLIALAVPELGNPYFAELAGAVIDAAAAHEYTVLLDHTQGLRERELLVAQGFRTRVIDGLILNPLELETEDLATRTDSAPLVLIGERRYDLAYDHIAIDNIAAARAAVRHLLELGRRRIAFLGARGDRPSQPAHLRLLGWQAELAANGALRAVDDGCQPGDFAALQPGEVAFTGFGTCFLWRKARNAKQAGASALIAQTSPSPRGVAFATLVVPNVGLPVVMMSRRVPARDGDRIRLTVDSAGGRGTTQNVIAELGPTSGPVAMAGAHLDSVPNGPGVNDDGSGVAALLEVAGTFGPRPPGRVRLGFWGAEEEGLIGSRAYVRSLTDAQRREITAYLNFDMLGSPNAVAAVYSWLSG